MEILDSFDSRSYDSYFNIKNSISRSDIINTIIQRRRYKSYLEIGTAGFDNYNNIIIEYKECIDPSTNGNYTYKMTSDEAFKLIINNNSKYDIVFIDGLHTSEQVTKDIDNSLLVLNPNGTIVLHDCNPPTPIHASYPPPHIVDRNWNGNCYKSIIQFRQLNPTIYTVVVNTDWGVGIIEPFNIIDNTESIDIPKHCPLDENDEIVGGPLIINDKTITWNFFNKNRTKLLNLISVEEFNSAYVLKIELMDTRLNKKAKYTIEELLGLSKKCDWFVHIGYYLNITNTDTPKNVFYSAHKADISFPFLINEIIPKIKNNFNLIIASEDFTFPTGKGDYRENLYSNYQDMIKLLLDNDNINHIYVENLDTMHPKMSPIPLGILNCSNNPISYLNNYDVINFNNKKINIFCCHREYYNNDYLHGYKQQFEDRRKVTTYCKNEWKNLVSFYENLNKIDFCNKIKESNFTLCVHGGGYDPSPRCWEALLLGSIPIIQHSPLDEAYSRYPVVFIDRWEIDAITEEKLNVWLTELKPFYEDKEKRKDVLKMLTLDYWWDIINL